MILNHCAGPLKDGHQNSGMRISFDPIHSKVIACENGTDAPDSGLWNGFLVKFQHTLNELAWVIEEVYPCSFKIPTSVAIEFIPSLSLWHNLHHMAGDFHSQYNCW